MLQAGLYVCNKYRIKRAISDFNLHLLCVYCNCAQCNQTSESREYALMCFTPSRRRSHEYRAVHLHESMSHPISTQ